MTIPPIRKPELAVVCALLEGHSRYGREVTGHPAGITLVGSNHLCRTLWAGGRPLGSYLCERFKGVKCRWAYSIRNDVEGPHTLTETGLAPAVHGLIKANRPDQQYKPVPLAAVGLGSSCPPAGAALRDEGRAGSHRTISKASLPRQ